MGYLRGIISRKTPWDVMPDLYFYREPEDIEKEEQAAAAAALKPEEPYPADWMLVLLLLQQSNHHKSLLQLTGQKNQQLPLIGALNHSHTKLEPKNGAPNQCQQLAKTSGEPPPLPATGVPNQPVPLPIGEQLLTQLV